jgi:hypothetical protein
MRRWMGLVLPALLALMLLAGPTAALADDATDGQASVVLAVDDGEPLGPEPQPRDAEDNPAGELFPDMETPFTWGAAWILTFAGLVGLALLVGLYYLLVKRPSRESAGRR